MPRRPLAPRPAVTANQTPILLAIVALLIMAMFAIVALQVLRPGDNTAVIASLIGALTPTVGVLLVLLNQQSTKQQSAITEQKVDELRVSVDGRLSQLLETSTGAAEAAGQAAGRAAAELTAAELAKVVKALEAAQTRLALQEARIRELAAHEAGLVEGTALPQNPPE